MAASKVLQAVRIEAAALKALKKELPIGKLLKLLPFMAEMKKNGEPWGSLPPPESEKDKASRALIGDAVLLYRALLKLLPQPEAERIVRRVITESAVAQLRMLIPKISIGEVKTLAPAARCAMFCGIVDQFPNADWVLAEEGETRFVFSITRCRLVELIIAAGHPELRDAFCAGDAVYFERHQPEIGFNRASKIAAGDDVCRFEFGITEGFLK